MTLHELYDSGRNLPLPDVQRTTLSIDVLGRYVTNTWDEAIENGLTITAPVIGAIRQNSWFLPPRPSPLRLRRTALLATLGWLLTSVTVSAEDVSPPPILQWFETSQKTMESRTPDVFLAGYGAVWVPPPGRAGGSGDGSDDVGYDPFDRFDLGGDNALLKMDGGLDLNGNGAVDFRTPGTVTYGFERFRDKSSPLIGPEGVNGTRGDGQFIQTIDATKLEPPRGAYRL